MRNWLVFVLVPLFGCTDSTEAPQEVALEIISADITLAPGEETTKCFYFHTTNTTTLHVNKWVSDMTPGSHHMIVFQSLGTQPADGTIDDCDGANAPVPIYGSQIPHEELAFPKDDGLGKPLAQVIEPGTAGFFQMHYLNATDEPLPAHVELKAYALPEASEFTRTEIFGTYNNDISIPPGATNHTVSATCETFVDRKFWSMSSHSHKQSVRTTIKDGATTLVSSTDWEHPDVLNWGKPNFYKFSSGMLTWECTYDNTGDNATRTVVAGQSAQTNEMCMAVGYFFPAVGPRGCIKDSGTCQCLL